VKRSEEGGQTHTRSCGGTEASLEAPRDGRTSVRVTLDGPILVRGPIRVLDEGGNEVPMRRRVNAFCRCGRSTSQPFCDGTHKVVPFSPRPATGISA
jgi:CDGSH-type Zn-finger protein